MARVLAIETSGGIGSVALAEGGRVVAEEQFSHGLKHAAEIIPRIEMLCGTRGWKPVDLEEIHVSVGPGSFTSLRIGITFAKTLAFATGARLIAVPSLAVLAANSPAEAQNVLIVLDARRGQIYTALFAREGEEWVERQSAHLGELSSELQNAPRPIYLLGEGIPFHTSHIPSLDPRVIVTPETSWRARASVVAEIGWRLSAQGRWIDPDALLPLYIRRPEAEEKREGTARVP